MPEPPPLPSRRDLKATVLWCARWLLGDGEQYRGPITVGVTATKKGETVSITPTKGTDGLALPEGLGVVPAGTPTGYELLRVLLSEDEKTILRAVVEHPGAKVNAIESHSKIKHAKFFVLWTNLQARALVVHSDRGDGWALGVPWLTALILAAGHPHSHPSSVRLSAQDGG